MLKYDNPRRTWQYSNEFKVNAVQLSFTVGVIIRFVARKTRHTPIYASTMAKRVSLRDHCGG